MEFFFKKAAIHFQLCFLSQLYHSSNPNPNFYNYGSFVNIPILSFFQGKDDAEPKNPEDCTLHTS